MSERSMTANDRMRLVAGDALGALSRPFRVLSFASMGLVTAAYVSVFWWIASVVEAGSTLLAVAVGTWVVAVLAHRLIPPWMAVGLTGLLLAAGTAVYLSAIPDGLRFVLSVQAILTDLLILLSGVSVLNLTAIGQWATAFIPAPIFLSWYLFLRGREPAAAGVAGAVLGFLLLTGDAGTGAAIAGSVGIAGAVVLGELADRDAALGHLDFLAIGLAVMVVGSLGAATALDSASNPLSTGGEAESLEGSVVGAEEEMAIVGAVELSPTVRYTIESESPAYWRSDAYDRYTGGAWIQTGSSEPFEGILPPPPGPTEQVDHTVVVEDRVLSMPAAWKPREVVTATAAETRISPEEGIEPADGLAPGDRYRVVSERPDPDPATVRGAGTGYPTSIEDRYTQLPDSTPDRVGEYTSELTADAESPVESAERIEDHLSSEWSYSLDVDRPDGDIADAFLFEMEAGYCTYFATTMVVMLRTQGIPARMAVGYTPGERIDDDRYVVRGLDAHAWVEVYVPEVGWIPFEPTPGDSRVDVHGGALEDAREAGVADVDTPESADRSANATYGQLEDPSVLEEDDIEIGGAVPDEEAMDVLEDAEAFESGVDTEPSLRDRLLPDPSLIGIYLLVAIGVAAGARRMGLTDHPRRWVAMRWQGGRNDPAATVRRAYRRLELGLEAEYRPRRPGETPRQYVDRMIDRGGDPRARTVVRRYEQARYGTTIDADSVDETVETVDSILGVTGR